MRTMTAPRGHDRTTLHAAAGADQSAGGRGSHRPRADAPGGRTARAALDAIRLAVQRRQWMLAEGLVQAFLARHRPDAEALLYVALVHEAYQRFDLAREWARRSMRLQPDAGSALLLARMHRLRGETDAAIELCDRALKLSPGHLYAQVIKAGALEEAGRVEEASAIIAPLVEHAEREGREADQHVLNEWAKLLVQRKRHREAVTVIDRLTARADTDPHRRCNLLHLRAKACDKAGEFREAFESARAANAMTELPFDPDLYHEQVSMLMERWSRGAMERFPLSACASEAPVFVAGMPRSGTSLIDQIIHAHPKAAGVGELDTIDAFALELSEAWNPDLEPPECFGRFDSRKWTQTAERYVREVRKLAPGAERIVNKSLGNNRLVGLIARLFPKTRIIHAIRDPRDVAVSCFMGGFNNALHPWTTRLDWAARAWKQSMRMMEHWKATLDVPILDVHYERLVHQPEKEFPRIIEFLGLEWDDACNRFYESRRTVRTLSYDQVNRPLYTSSAGRHANYADFLEGIEFPQYDPFARVQ